MRIYIYKRKPKGIEGDKMSLSRREMLQRRARGIIFVSFGSSQILAFLKYNPALQLILGIVMIPLGIYWVVKK